MNTLSLSLTLMKPKQLDQNQFKVKVRNIQLEALATAPLAYDP